MSASPIFKQSVTFYPLHPPFQNELQGNCAICLENLVDSKSSLIGHSYEVTTSEPGKTDQKIFHLFHQQCFNDFFEEAKKEDRRPDCPLCRKEIHLKKTRVALSQPLKIKDCPFRLKELTQQYSEALEALYIFEDKKIRGDIEKLSLESLKEFYLEFVKLHLLDSPYSGPSDLLSVFIEEDFVGELLRATSWHIENIQSNQVAHAKERLSSSKEIELSLFLTAKIKQIYLNHTDLIYQMQKKVREDSQFCSFQLRNLLQLKTSVALATATACGLLSLFMIHKEDEVNLNFPIVSLGTVFFSSVAFYLIYRKIYQINDPKELLEQRLNKLKI
jgi:hypothetical protein